MSRLEFATSVLAICMFGWACVVGDEEPSSERAPRRFAAGQLLVAPAPGVSDDELERLYAAYGGRLERIIPGIGVHLIRVPTGTEDQVEAALARSPKVGFVEKNYMGRDQ